MSEVGCRVRVCRDCCCGTARKHPGVDHAGLLDRLTRGVGGAGEVAVAGCLLACDRSDVVVVSPSARGRRNGARPVWLGWVLDEEAVDTVCDWVVRGGPGVVRLPPTLAAHAVSPPALAERFLDEMTTR